MANTSPRNSSGTRTPSEPPRKLSELARKLVTPSGITSTWWLDVRNLCTGKLGLGFDLWQDGAGRLILAKREDGKLASMIGGVGMSLPRQVGKTYLIAAIVFALCILFPKLLVVWSAHHSKTHGETFLAMQDFASRSKVKPYIRKVYTGSGDEEIRFRNGSRILFGARERGFGRGIPGVDVIVADEAQIMSDKALDAQLATMNTSWFGLAIYVGTPPRPDDPSEAFTRMRSEAWSGGLEDSVWIELGAEPGDDPNDRKTWAKANPSFPRRTPAESILRLKKKLKPDSFLREGLGVWDEQKDVSSIFPNWAGCSESVLSVKLTLPAGKVSVGVATDQDREFASVVWAWEVAGRKAVDVVRREGTDWVIPYLAERKDRIANVCVDAGSPAATLLPGLGGAGLPVRVGDTAAARNAHADLVDAVKYGRFVHRDNDVMNTAARMVKWRAASGGQVVARRDSGCPIDPLEASAWALWGLTPDPKKKEFFVQSLSEFLS